MISKWLCWSNESDVCNVVKMAGNAPAAAAASAIVPLSFAFLLAIWFGVDAEGEPLKLD